MRAAGREEDVINTEEKKIQRDNGCAGGGKLYVVGIGPGGAGHRSRAAEEAIGRSTVVAGYKLYLEHVADIIAGKKLVSSGMKKERERCLEAVQLAAGGEVVSLVSSGDAGIYGMAGLAMEVAEKEGCGIEIEVVPGISAANAAAAVLGAPLMLDFACISLSDLLVPWDVIRKRLEAVAAADLVVAIYNPKSNTRVSQLGEAAEIFLSHRSASTPVGVVTAAGTAGEVSAISDLGSFQSLDINMRSIVIIGNSTTRVIGGRMVTPRGYEV